jgi:hypothetical protein
VVGRVVAQPLVEGGERVVAREHLVRGKHLPLLGVEQEHEPEYHGEEGPVDLVGVVS